jgi:hypothetical protein
MLQRKAHRHLSSRSLLAARTAERLDCWSVGGLAVDCHLRVLQRPRAVPKATDLDLRC